jgi:hypothetical protein
MLFEAIWNVEDISGNYFAACRSVHHCDLSFGTFWEVFAVFCLVALEM